MKGKLHRVTRASLEPLWERRNIPVSRVAAVLGVTEQGLIYHAKKLGLAPRTKAKCVIDTDEFRAMWEFGVSRKEMAVHFGLSRDQSVGQKAKQLRLEKRRAGGQAKQITVARFREWQVGQQMAAARSCERSTKGQWA